MADIDTIWCAAYGAKFAICEDADESKAVADAAVAEIDGAPECLTCNGTGCVHERVTCDSCEGAGVRVRPMWVK